MKNEKKQKTYKYKYYDIKSKQMLEKTMPIKSGKESPPFIKKTLLFIIVCLLQLVLLTLYFIYLMGEHNWLMYAAQGVSLLCCVRVIASDKNSESKIAWVIFLLTLYFVGFIIYFIWGELSTTPLKRFKLKKIRDNTQFVKAKDLSPIQNARVRQESEFIQRSASFVPYVNCGCRYFPGGEDFFQDLLEKLEKAEKFIFIEFFIISEGQLLAKFVEILTKKAAEGIEVKIIYDGLGSNDTLSNGTIKTLKRAGVKILGFEKFVPVFNLFVIYRDHRKIVVIDGKTAYTGGVNLADEYINEKKRHGFWKDSGIRVDGAAADSFTLMFLRMWEYLTKEKPQYQNYIAIGPPLQKEENNAPAIMDECEKIDGGNIVMPYSDGPDDNVLTAKGVYSQMIGNAKNYVYIMTPYFILDDTITELLKNKALSGVDVRIILPGIPDKKTVYLFSRANAEKLIEHGVRVYKFTPGFIHSKNVISDDECAVVGSVNMDFRSFYQQYECALYTTVPSALKDIKNDFDETFLNCEEILQKHKLNIFVRFFLAFIKVFTPLM